MGRKCCRHRERSGCNGNIRRDGGFLRESTALFNEFSELRNQFSGCCGGNNTPRVRIGTGCGRLRDDDIDDFDDVEVLAGDADVDDFRRRCGRTLKVLVRRCGTDTFLAGREIRLTNVHCGNTITARSNCSGVAIFENLHPGEYICACVGECGTEREVRVVREFQVTEICCNCCGGFRG